jgi:multiple sugar transport system permease protein
MKPKAAAVALYAALALGAALALLPMLWMVSASFMAPGEAGTYPPRLLPRAPTLEHYRTLFTRLDLGRYLLNSTIIALAVTALSLLINSMAGYAFAKLRFRGRTRIFRTLAAGLVVPVQVAMLPLFLLLKQFGLINTYWGVIIPGLASISASF